MFDSVRSFGNFVVFFETWLLGLGKISYIALGLMRNGLVFRTTVRSLKCLAAALQKCPMMSKYELVGPRLSDWGNGKGLSC